MVIILMSGDFFLILLMATVYRSLLTGRREDINLVSANCDSNWGRRALAGRGDAGKVRLLWRNTELHGCRATVWGTM